MEIKFLRLVCRKRDVEKTKEGIFLQASVQTIVSQIFIMFLLMFLGHLLYRRKMIDETFSKQLSALLLNVVTPAVLIISYQRPFDREDARQLALAFFYSVLTFLVAIAAAWLLFGRSKKPYAKDARMCVIFSNNGFMAIPLLQALLGPEGVFLGSASIVTATVIAWTYGARILSGENRTDLKKILLNPGTLALLGGVLLFCSPWKLPGPIFQAAEYLGGLNTPLGMMVLGVNLSQAKVLSCLKDKTVYLISFVKLLATPLLAAVVLYILGAQPTTAMALLIGVAAPSGVISSMMAQMFGTDYRFSARVVAVTTLLSAVTMPLFLVLAQQLW